MKLKEMKHICFDEGLQEQDLLISFLMKIIPKKEIDSQYYEYSINEGQLAEWVKRFKSGNPIKEMTKEEKKKFIAIIFHKLED